MARVRLFANLREAAGTAELEVPGETVREILAGMSKAYGPDFRAGLRHAQVWVNGRAAEPESTVREQDEVAIIPPVSGGATAVRSAASLQAGLVALLVALVVVANLRSAELLVGAVVALGGLWVWDAVTEAGRTGLHLDRWPMLLAVLVGAIVPYRMGMTGLGIAAAAVVTLTLVWGVARFGARTLPSLAGTFAGGFAVSLAIASLVVTRLGPQGSDRVNAYLLMVISAGLATFVLTRYPVSPLIDPLTGSALAVVLAGASSGVIWETSVVTMLLVGVAVALALIAGRAFGSLLRLGEVYLAETVPGTLSAFDGPLIAAMVLAPMLGFLT